MVWGTKTVDMEIKTLNATTVNSCMILRSFVTMISLYSDCCEIGVIFLSYVYDFVPIHENYHSVKTFLTSAYQSDHELCKFNLFKAKIMRMNKYTVTEL